MNKKELKKFDNPFLWFGFIFGIYLSYYFGLIIGLGWLAIIGLLWKISSKRN